MNISVFLKEFKRCEFSQKISRRIPPRTRRTYIYHTKLYQCAYQRMILTIKGSISSSSNKLINHDQITNQKRIIIYEQELHSTPCQRSN